MGFSIHEKLPGSLNLVFLFDRYNVQNNGMICQVFLRAPLSLLKMRCHHTAKFDSAPDCQLKVNG
ncbi:MAG: hypothetical protein ACSHXD_11545, partial [Marinosulfonomonas sp.]